MSFVQRILWAYKASRELGIRRLGLYAWYQIGLLSGYLVWQTRAYKRWPQPPAPARPTAIESRLSRLMNRTPAATAEQSSQFILNLPPESELRSTLGPDGIAQLKKEADEILSGKVRLFGGEAVPLQLQPPGELHHWTDYALDQGMQEHIAPLADIKLVWEAGRFGWALTLARAYYVSRDERYAEGFWRYFELFLESNPPNLGPHWCSAQEVALRLIALVYATHLFHPSSNSTPARLGALRSYLADHAARIPPTLPYARSLNNNHLLVEAAGLYTAGLYLADQSKAPEWLELGRSCFHQALQAQIAEDGTYVQHSTNYHRLMLQIALWIDAIQPEDGITPTTQEEAHSIPVYRAEVLPEKAVHVKGSVAESYRRLYAATHWLLDLIDPTTGRVPNLGPNDGAYILPLTICPFNDYRPVVQAASLAFTGKRAFPPGPWDEMAAWFRRREPDRTVQKRSYTFLRSDVGMARISQREAWAYLRAVRFTTRPGHADQLHLDLWWRGMNIAQDAGTYLYNAPHPWDNSLAGTEVHNTVSLQHQDQMTRAGRFLWLDWAQGEVIAREHAPDGSWERLVAQHHGYHRLGVLHQRSVTGYASRRWLVEDHLTKAGGPAWPINLIRRAPSYTVRLHWLLPDWPWEVVEDKPDQVQVRLLSPFGYLFLRISNLTEGDLSLKAQISRAGQMIYGYGMVSPTWGWSSPTYAEKIPALAFAVEVEASLPIHLTSEWDLPSGDQETSPAL
jgi:hypothetical protein